MVFKQSCRARNNAVCIEHSKISMRPSGLLIFEDTRLVQMFCLGLPSSVQEISSTARFSESVLEPSLPKTHDFSKFQLGHYTEAKAIIKNFRSVSHALQKINYQFTAFNRNIREGVPVFL